MLLFYFNIHLDIFKHYYYFTVILTEEKLSVNSQPCYSSFLIYIKITYYYFYYQKKWWNFQPFYFLKAHIVIYYVKLNKGTMSFFSTFFSCAIAVVLCRLTHQCASQNWQISVCHFSQVLFTVLTVFGCVFLVCCEFNLSLSLSALLSPDMCLMRRICWRSLASALR